MLVKVAILFLAAMLAIAVFGNLLFPDRFQRRVGRRAAPTLNAKCRGCGRPRIGKGPCPCGKG